MTDFKLRSAIVGALIGALALGAGVTSLQAQQDTTRSRSSMSQDTTRTKTTTKHKKTTRAHKRTNRSADSTAMRDTSGYGRMQRDTSSMMRRDTSSMMRSDTSMRMRTDSTKMRSDSSMRRDTSAYRSMQQNRTDSSGATVSPSLPSGNAGSSAAGAPVTADTSAQHGVTPNRAGLQPDSAHPHPEAGTINSTVPVQQGDTMNRHGAVNPPGMTSAPAGDTTQNRGQMTRPSSSDSSSTTTKDSTSSSSSSSSSTSTSPR